MRKLPSAAVAVAALAVAGLGVVSATANAATAAPALTARPAASWSGGSVRANEEVVEAFIQDVLDGHQEASGFFTPDATWSGGTVGTVTGGQNVAALFDSSAAALPDEHVTLEDIFGAGNQVVVQVDLPPQPRQDRQHHGRR
jgi:hypothetical protein